jgi:hypothetical protein
MRAVAQVNRARICEPAHVIKVGALPSFITKFEFLLNLRCQRSVKALWQSNKDVTVYDASFYLEHMTTKPLGIRNTLKTQKKSSPNSL